MKKNFIYIITFILVTFNSCRIVETNDVPEYFPAKRRVFEQVNIINRCIDDNIFYFYLANKINKWKDLSDSKEIFDFENKYLSQFRLIKVNDTINFTSLENSNNKYKNIKIIMHDGSSLYDKDSRWEIQLHYQLGLYLDVNLFNKGNNKHEIVYKDNKYKLEYEIKDNQANIKVEGEGNVSLTDQDEENINGYYRYYHDKIRISNILFNIAKTISLNLDLNKGYKNNSFIELLKSGKYTFKDYTNPEAYDVIVNFHEDKCTINYREATYIIDKKF